MFAVVLSACLPAGLQAASAELEDAQRLFDTGRYDECERLAAEQVERGIWNEAWWRLKIETDLATGFYGDALETLEKGLNRWRGSIRMNWLGHRVYLFNNQPEKAAELLAAIDNMVRLNPWRYSDAANRVTVGRYMLSRGADARQVLELMYDHAKKQLPDYVDAYVASGDLALEKNDFAVAAQEFERALKLEPDDAHVHFKLALAYASSEPARAEALLDKTLAANPRHAGALLLQADRLIDAEQYEQAEQRLQRVLDVNEQHPEAWAYRAVIAHLAGDAEGERMCRGFALCSYRTNPEVDHLIGRKLSQHYRFAEGAAYQRRALAIDDKYLPAKMQLCQDLLRLGQDAEGWRLADEVNQQDGYNVVAHNLVTLEQELSKFRTLEEDGFVLRMDAREAELYGPEALALLKDARDTLAAKYDAPLDGPVTVEIFPDQKDFAIRTFGLPGGAGFLGVCFGHLITMNSPASQGGNPANWQSVLWHEFCHVVTLTKTRNKMPRWLSEGISVYEERQRDATWGQTMNPRYRSLVLDGELTPVSQLSGAFLNPRSPLHLQFAYYESSLVVEYLIDEYGLDVLKRILTDLGAGMPINESLQRYTGSLEALDREFAAFARRRAESLAPDLDFDPIELPPDATWETIASWTKAHPNNYWGLRRLASQLIAEKKWEEAKAPLSQLVESYPRDVSAGNALQMLAAVHRNRNETDKERAALEKLVALDADNIEATMRLMDIVETAGDWAALLSAADRALAVDPLRRIPHERAARAAEELGKHSRAARHAQAAILLDPIDPAEAHYRLARLLQKTGDLTAARRQVVMALEEAPRYRAAHRTLLEIVAAMELAKQSKVSEDVESTAPQGPTVKPSPDTKPHPDAKQRDATPADGQPRSDEDRS